MTDSPARPTRSAAARIAARYAPSDAGTRPLRTVEEEPATAPIPVAARPVGATSATADPVAATPAAPVEDEDHGHENHGHDDERADLVPFRDRAVTRPDARAEVVRTDRSQASDGVRDARSKASLPGVFAGSRMLHLLGLLAAGLLSAGALVLVAPVVTDLADAGSTRAFAGTVLVGLGAIALIGVARWLDHTLSDRVARRYANQLLTGVVENHAEHPAAVSRLGAHSVRAVRDANAHLHARLVPLVVLLAGAAVALTLVHRSLALVAAAPLIMLGAAAAATAVPASRAVREERRARHELTTSLAEALAPPAVDDEVMRVDAHVVHEGRDHEPEPGEDAVADTLDPVDDEALQAARPRAVRGSGAGAGSGAAEPDRDALPADVRAALDAVGASESASADALGTLRGVGIVVVGFGLAAVATAAFAAGVPAAEIVGALVVTGVATTAALDVVEGARFVPAASDARRAVARALGRGE
ncbi:hypothetical protein ACPYO6_16725 [Georgenia sp. Z1344]|uniref:hypothetical protein n=1 Tax=Georgenia sp. Z1344 TaxID=3416706 RepID=UPI003CFAFF43